VNAAPDGYTVLLVGMTNAINVSYYRKLSFNFVRDIAPVASITQYLICQSETCHELSKPRAR
jgi:hypothetical protein